MQMYLSTYLVQRINGLVREETVVDIPVCQSDTRRDSLLTVVHMMMLFVTLLDIMQDIECLLSIGGLNDNLLEASLQGTVFLNGVTILIQCRCTNTLYSATCQGGFHDIGSIHGSWCTAGTYKRVYLINKHNNVRILLQLLEQCPDAFLKLTAILCASHDSCHIEVHQTLII